MQKTLYRLTISALASAYENLCAMLATHLSYGWQEELSQDKIQFIVHNEEKNFLEALSKEIEKNFSSASLEIEEIENTDWLSSWKEFFTPVPCGRNYLIIPPWLRKKAYKEKYKIVINPKSAFGTGHHASTVLCLTALDNLLSSGILHDGQTFLDLGCGTGVLGIGAAMAGLNGICIDIDPLAVENAKENANLNKVEQALKIMEGSIEHVQGQRFDLIMANILAAPLIAMAPAITKCLAKTACLILSGILLTQADEVLKAYMECSLPEPKKLVEGEWCALVWS